MRMRRRIQAAFDDLFRRVDLLVTFTLPWAATPIDRLFTPVPVTRGFTGMVAASNLAGLPALFLPVGLTQAGLPVGIQIVAPPFREDLLVALGESFQGATSWHRLRPPALAGGVTPAGDAIAEHAPVRG
jgi:aspartyl-tRNA(Asn)/glutamyl-tRNA(Gln) amidotransferase subunit A